MPLVCWTKVVIVCRMAPGSLKKRNSLDENGFPIELADPEPFIPKPAYMCMQEQEEFDDISWDDGTITTRGTMNIPSVPRIMPVQFKAKDNPFAYECGGKKSSITGSTSRPNRRASLSATDCTSREEPRAQRFSRRRSSLSNVNRIQPVCNEEALPTFAGEGILSTTTIDQGNGQRVCVVVIKLDDSEKSAAKKPQGDETNEKPAERRDSNRKSSEHTGLDRKSSELRSIDRKSSERRRGLDRKFSERNSSGHTRRRPSGSKAGGSGQISEDKEKENRREAHRLRRYSSGVVEKNNLADTAEFASDRPPRRRSSLGRAASGDSRDEKGSGRDPDRQHRRSSLSSGVEDKNNAADGTEPTSDRPRRRRSSVDRAASSDNSDGKGTSRDSDRQRRRSSISSGVDDKTNSTDGTEPTCDRPRRRRSSVGRAGISDSRNEKGSSGDPDRQRRRSTISSGVDDKTNSADGSEPPSDRPRRRRSSVSRASSDNNEEIGHRRQSSHFSYDDERNNSANGTETFSDRPRRRRSSVGRRDDSDGKGSRRDSDREHRRSSTSTHNVDSEANHGFGVSKEPTESGRSRDQHEKKTQRRRKSQSSTDV